MNSTNIKLNENTSIDLQKLIDSRLLIQANSGGGKSWLIRRILEQSYGNVQHIVIDLEGEFSTLREKYDYLIVGKEGDIPAISKTAGIISQRILELGVSAIIDLYEMPPQERKHYVKLFLEGMINAPKELWKPVIVVIDEAHIFVPEKGESEAAGAVIDLATRGRKRGFCAILATQRLSKLNKDAAAECNNKLIGRASQDIDMKRASEELGFTSKKQMLSLRDLEAGEFYAFGVAISREVVKIQVGEVKTSHPKVGSRMLGKVVPPTPAIKAALKKMADLPKEAEKKLITEKELREEITRLKREKITSVVDQRTIDRAVSIAITNVKKQTDNSLASLTQENRTLSDKLSQINKLSGINVKQITHIIPVKIEQPKPVYDYQVPESKKIVIESTDENEKPLTGGSIRMLKILASRSPMKLTKSQLGTFAKVKPSGGSFSTYLSILKTKGYVVVEGDLIYATDKGIEISGETPNMPSSPDEVQELWKNNLHGGARRMFEILIESYPSVLSKEDLGNRSGVSPSGGSFSTYLSILRSNGLIENSSGGIKATDHVCGYTNY